MTTNTPFPAKERQATHCGSVKNEGGTKSLQTVQSSRNVINYSSLMEHSSFNKGLHKRVCLEVYMIHFTSII